MHSSSKLPDGLVIPDHHLERRIGEGGYGEIWLARNVIGTYRAVKIVFRSRFESPKPYEREFTGLKSFEPISRNHPGFVDILQVGRNDELGYIYYVMELADDEVSGRIVDPDTYSAKSLSRERDKHGRLPAAECLRIAKSLTASLSHLHQAGLVHRDIKPSNIIFVNGEPKLADIGLVVSLSEANTFVGSDGYIPPEGPGTCQADIYSLGKLLYEISTGQDKNQFPELPRDVGAFEDAPLLFELNEVILKAGENDPRRRYKTANEVQADLDMIASGGSVKQLRFIQRQLTRVRRVAVAAVALALIAISFAVVVNSLRQKERRALAKAHVTTGVKSVEDGNAGAGIPSFAAALRIQHNDEAATEANRLRIGSTLQHLPALLQFWDIGKTVHALKFSPDGKKILGAGGKFVRIFDVESGGMLRELTVGHNVNDAAFSPDGSRLAVGNGDYLTMFDPNTGETNFQKLKRSGVLSVAFSPDGQLIVAGGGSSTTYVMDASTGTPSGSDLKGHTKDVRSASFSPDGNWIVTASRDGTGRLWDAKTREFVALLPQQQWVNSAAFSPDGTRMATASSDNSVFVWNVSATPTVSARAEHYSAVQNLTFSPDGHWIASASLDRTVRFWEAKSGKPSAATINLRAPGLLTTFSPDGSRVATAEQSGRIGIWQMPATGPIAVGPAIMSEDDERYVTYGWNTFRIWNARTDAPLTPPLLVTGTITSICASADAQIVAACAPEKDGSSTIHVYDLTAKAVHSFEILSARNSVLLSPDGKLLLATNGHVLTVYESLTGEKVCERYDFTQRVACAVFSPDNRAIAMRLGRSVHVLDAVSGSNRFKPFLNSDDISSLSFTPDSTHVVISSANDKFVPGASSFLNASTGKPGLSFTQHADGIKITAFTPDGKTAATAGEDSFVFVWKTATGEPLFDALRLPVPFRSVRFSRDGRWLVACGWNEAQLWDVDTGRALTPGFYLPRQGRFNTCGIVAGKGRLWLRSDYNLYFWDLPQASGEADELLALAYQLGVSIPAGIKWNPAAYASEKLHARAAEERKQAEKRTIAWHEQQAYRFENTYDPDWFAARFHLQQLLQRNPERVDLRARLANVTEKLAGKTKPVTDDSENQTP